MVGEVQANGSSQTAFIKVYQDAGVIGVAMLTLLTLCILLGILAYRTLKMYASTIEARDNLETARTLAIERVSNAVIALSGTVQSAIAEMREEHGKHMKKIDDVCAAAERNNEILRRVETEVDSVSREMELARRLTERN